MTSKHLPAAPVHPPTREAGRTGADSALSPPSKSTAQRGVAALSPSPWGAVSGAGFPRGRRRAPPRGAGLAVPFGPPSGPRYVLVLLVCVFGFFLPVTLRNIPGRETESPGLRELAERCFQLKYLLGTLKVSNVITV